MYYCQLKQRSNGFPILHKMVILKTTLENKQKVALLEVVCAFKSHLTLRIRDQSLNDINAFHHLLVKVNTSSYFKRGEMSE